jgi:hypothetical protein
MEAKKKLIFAVIQTQSKNHAKSIIHLFLTKSYKITVTYINDS